MLRKHLRAIADCDTPTALWKAQVLAFRAEGFSGGSYVLLTGTRFAPMKPISFGFPGEVVRKYLSLDYARLDAASRRAIAGGQVLTWDEAWSKGTNTPEEEAFRAQFAAPVKVTGLSIPCYGPHQRNGCAAIQSADPDRTFSPAERRWLQAIAQSGHIRLCELLFDHAPAVVLSPREREVLHWVALGKSNSVIAQLLSCSSNTVDTHLRRSYAKMQVADRTSAAIKAIGLGLIN